MRIGVSRIASALRNRAGFGEGTPQQDSMRAKWADGEIWTHGRILLYATQLLRFFRFCQSVKLALCRTFDFAVLPECRSCPRISLWRIVLFGTLVQFAVVAILRWRTYPIQTVIRFLDVEPAECFWEKQKEPITQSTKNRRERGSRFKMMFYVIGSEDQSRVLLSYCSRQQNQRRSGAVRHFRCADTVSDETDLWWNIGIQLCHHYTDTSLIRQVSECLSLYSEFQRAIFNGIRKRSLYWLGHLGAIYQRVLWKILKNALK